MNCRKVTHLLSAYIDGELPGVECLQIREHISLCEECSSEYDDVLGMKRLLGRLKIQEPAQELPTNILQNIRIDTDQREQRSPLSRLQRFGDSLRATLPRPEALGVGLTVAIVAGLIYVHARNVSANQVQVVGEWNHSTPPASEFTAGANYANANRFVRRPPANAGGGAAIEDVSYRSSGFGSLYQVPSSGRPNSRYEFPGR